ncbi:hypothetical protein [Paractinoplanes toevensis]|uniref:Uncharacterized protein n=1 Tax=Paractinoplanes toevensis TaxID=571911 RepID=A0A919WDC8_9ACTN|nr:hypothetical protein [Actinoplanes toevensis]GIM98051.1 hypothetical protein Ato02nite_098440 [Actinoplanes toevensis]
MPAADAGGAHLHLSLIRPAGGQPAPHIGVPGTRDGHRGPSRRAPTVTVADSHRLPTPPPACAGGIRTDVAPPPATGAGTVARVRIL